MTAEADHGAAPGAPDVADEAPATRRAPQWLAPTELDIRQFAPLAQFPEACKAARDAGVDLRVMVLPFFRPTVCLVRLVPADGSEVAAAYGIWSRHGLFPYDGTSAPVHDANAREGLRLTADNILDYVVYFCRHVRGDEGPFWVVLHPDDLNDDGPPPDAAAGQGGGSRAPESCILRPVIGPGPGGEGWSVTVSVQFGGAIFKATFHVKPGGDIEMADGDEILTMGVPCNPARNAPPLAWNWTGTAFEFPGRGPAAPRHPDRRAVNQSVTEILVRMQLLQALRAGDAAPLFAAGAADDDQLLADFARFVMDSAAMVVVESRMDYVERVVGDLLLGQIKKPVTVTRSRFSSEPPDPPGVLVPAIDDGELVEISLHEGNYVRRCQAVAFTLGATDAAALVGCRGAGELPGPLRQIVDVTLRLRAVDAASFPQLFAQVFNCDWPAEQDPGSDWLGYLEPADLERALRDRAFREASSPPGQAPWQATDALAAMESRVRERLARFLPAETRRLADLVGLGAARQVVQDLMADFGAALAGRVGWDEVDRGMLLVGPPGTGKTMLARVLARECGVRFVSARIGGWMTGDSNLGAVIANMRQTFSDARQYAPCILFLDEIDSLGNRQFFGDHNSGWDTSFLTAVLAELQGFDELRGVFVVGATNHEDHVDPALRRAGRLDQVVRLDYPPVTDLAQILGQYLEPYRAAGRLADDIDLAGLAAVMAGNSGADVEQCVRDAARRARRDAAPIGARHLLAAATGVPRRPMSGPAHAPEEQERTAWHEAGHAVAQLTSGSDVGNLAVVSVVPRSDGSLGYVGLVPSDATAWTARRYRDHIEVMLAGRAAEELLHGAAAVSSGAGGSTDSCDLAVATRTAARMLCEACLGEPGRLQWRTGPGGPGDVAAIEALLADCYAATLERLRRHRPLVAALAQRLVARGQMLGPEVRELARQHGVER